jgi:hypothetical protein
MSKKELDRIEKWGTKFLKELLEKEEKGKKIKKETNETL